MAAALVTQYGGIAWDENGEIHLQVPTPHAGILCKAMEAIRAHTLNVPPTTPSMTTPNGAALMMCGVGYPDDQGLIKLLMVRPDGPKEEPPEITIEEPFGEDGKWVVWTPEWKVTAPHSWGHPVVHGGGTPPMSVDDSESIETIKRFG